jgi:hypothetical protein
VAAVVGRSIRSLDRKVTKLLSAMVGLLAIGLCGCASYRTGPITATVVDSITGAPVEGAHVVVVWTVEHHVTKLAIYGESNTYFGLLTEMEAITDSNGSFHIPAWDSSVFPDGPQGGDVGPSQPRIYLFKSGYRTNVVGNNGFDGKYRVTPYRSEWDGRKIALTRFSENSSLEERVRSVSGPDYLMIQDCAWKSIPNYLSALLNEREEIRKANPAQALRSRIPSMDDINRSGDPAKCGRAEDVLKLK